MRSELEAVVLAVMVLGRKMRQLRDFGVKDGRRTHLRLFWSYLEGKAFMW